MSRAGVLTCAADIVCSGTPKQARFNIQGTNKLTILLTYTGGTLTNGTDSIPFTADGPASMYADQFGRAGHQLRRRRVARDQPDAGRRRLHAGR